VQGKRRRERDAIAVDLGVIRAREDDGLFQPAAARLAVTGAEERQSVVVGVARVASSCGRGFSRQARRPQPGRVVRQR